MSPVATDDQLPGQGDEDGRIARATAAQSHNANSRLLVLPSELRNRIYFFAGLAHLQDSAPPPSNLFSMRPVFNHLYLPSSFQICRQVLHEANAVFRTEIVAWHEYDADNQWTRLKATDVAELLDASLSSRIPLQMGLWGASDEYERSYCERIYNTPPQRRMGTVSCVALRPEDYNKRRTAYWALRTGPISDEHCKLRVTHRSFIR